MSLKVIQFDPPIPEALVVFVDSVTKKIVTGGLTDSEGKIYISLREGTYDLYVAKEEYLAYCAKGIQVTGNMTINVTLTRVYGVGILLNYAYDVITEKHDLGLSMPSLGYEVNVETEVEKQDLTLQVPDISYEISVEEV